MTIFSSGISLHALAKLMVTLHIGLSYWPCIYLSASIVLVYIFLGGLTSAIYNEVLQFFMIVLGFAPLVYLGLKNVGGWIAPRVTFPSEMSQNFRLAIVAWTFCFVVTVVVSVLTPRTKTDGELTGLVCSLTPRPKSEDEPWYRRPVVLGMIILALTLVLNLVFA